MKSNLQKIKLLAFIVCHKWRRRNSCVYHFEKKYRVAKELDMSVNTYSKLLKECILLGYARIENETIVFNSLKVILQETFDFQTNKKFKAFINVRFFTDEKRTTYKVLYETIQAQISLLNFRQQLFVNGLLNDVQCMLQNRIIADTKVLRKAKKLTQAQDYTEVESICTKQEKVVRTGKFHLSNILGCSPSTAAKRLRRWDGTFFTRTINYEYIKATVNNQSFDAIKSIYAGGVIPCAGGFKVVKGSILDIL